MKTKEEFEKLVSDLTELEMTDLVEECIRKVHRDRMQSLILMFKADDFGAMEDLEDEVKELESKNEKLQDKLERAQNLAREAISTLEDI